MSVLFFILYLAFTLVVLYSALPKLIWEVGSALYLIGASLFLGINWILGLILLTAIAIITAINRFEPLRSLISDFVFKRAIKSAPTISKTEEEALNAGDVWLEKDIFIGKPDWDRLYSICSELRDDEQSFLDNETETLCSMLNDWNVTQARDLPESVWTFMKDNGFFGLVIDKAYGGRGFSARAHSDIVLKISTRCGSAAVTVMVPNSLGPGELLQHYGTTEQKKHYLPRLASGLEIPCFALTEPNAGSDATSIQSEAIVIEKKIGGKLVLGLQIKLNKRWITLAPVATLIGIAVQLKDPHGLLKGKGQEGITCILIPRDSENLEVGNRHLPASQIFMNGTVRGENIFAPIDSIIGGQEKAGQGWKMLVECLSIGRSISLPALSTASSMVSYVTSGAFSSIRRQFNVEIAQFEGVEEKLAEIAGLNYLINATRLLTLAAVDSGIKPSVASAITKYFNTELARIAVNDAMDVHAGRTVVLGPRNYLMASYQAIPITITVEGANILTRNLLIFGQGSIACHPFVRDEFNAMVNNDNLAFRGLIWQHASYFLHNMAKTICTSLTGGVFIQVPRGPMRREYQRLSRLSYAFAWLADFALLSLGGSLKRRERLSARLADGMSYLYLAMATLRFANAQGNGGDHQIHAKWAVRYCFYQAQKSLIDFCRNFPSKTIGFLLRVLAFPFGQSMRHPTDKDSHKLAKCMHENNAYREFLIKSIYLSDDINDPMEQMENAFQLISKNKDLYKRIRDLRRCSLEQLPEKLKEKVEAKEITQKEMELILVMEKQRWNAMQVDEFTPESLKQQTPDSEKIAVSV